MKPARGSNDPPLSHPQGFRDTLARTPGGHFNFISTQQNSHILAETKVEGSLLVHPSETLVHGLQSFRLEIGVKTRTRKRPSQTPACKTSRAGNSLQSRGRRQPVSPLGPGSFSLSLAREGSQAMPTPFGLEETLPSHRLLGVCCRPVYLDREAVC